MTKYSYEYSNDFKYLKRCLRYIGEILQRTHYCHRGKSLQNINQKYGESGFSTQNTQSVGAACIVATVLSNVHSVVAFANPHRTRDRA